MKTHRFFSVFLLLILLVVFILRKVGRRRRDRRYQGGKYGVGKASCLFAYGRYR